MSGEQKDRIMCQGAFVTTGTYQVWVRGYAPNAAGDSIDMSLDGATVITSPVQSISGFAPREWDWANTTITGNAATIEITEPGLHTLHLWQREDGLQLDRILLTTDSTYIPTGNGPSESNRTP